MTSESLLEQPRLSVVASTADAELVALQDKITHKAVVGSRADLEDLFCRLLASAGKNMRAKTLDLIGCSTPGSCLLSLGSFAIDGANPIVCSYFRELAENDVLPRLGVNAVRLLGCLTADTSQGQWTICALSDILGLEVYGTKNLIHANHFGASGFSDEHSYFLSHSSDLRRSPPTSQPLLFGEPDRRVLDLDSLPARPLAELATTMWPRRFASREAAGEILALIQRKSGRSMPGLLATPSCELALPSATAGAYYVAHVLLDGSLVRIYPNSLLQNSVCYAVHEPRELAALVEALPQTPTI